VRDGEFVLPCSGRRARQDWTTLRMIAGLELPPRGRSSSATKTDLQARIATATIAFVFHQLFALYPHITCGGNIACAPKARFRAVTPSPPQSAQTRGDAAPPCAYQLLDKPCSACRAATASAWALGRRDRAAIRSSFIWTIRWLARPPISPAQLTLPGSRQRKLHKALPPPPRLRHPHDPMEASGGGENYGPTRSRS